MISRCRNCTGQLTFDPGKQMLICDNCGGTFAPGDYGVTEKELLWDTKVESLSDIYGLDAPEYIDRYVYICKSCGGEVIINGTEVSTRCLYCGNTAVVFSRITKQKRPGYILPFKLSADEALGAVRERFGKGLFIPKSIRNFKQDEVRGIYIPYWIVNCRHKGSVVVSGSVRSGRRTRTEYFGRAGVMNITGLPLDGSRMLSDESSSRLEPYNLDDLTSFSEEYLLGFYSNISDVTYGNLKSAASKRADEYFDELVLRNVHEASSIRIHSEQHRTDIDYKHLKYAMLPAWFITYTHNGTHNTVVVNGQTGKVVCGVPWDKRLFFLLMTAAGLLLTGLFFLIFRNLLPLLIDFNFEKSTAAGIEILAVIAAGTIALFSCGIARIRKVMSSIDLTQDVSIFNFAGRRQG